MIRDLPKLMIRLPLPLKAWLAATATMNRRSMSREVEHRLAAAMQAEQATKAAAAEPTLNA